MDLTFFCDSAVAVKLRTLYFASPGTHNAAGSALTPFELEGGFYT